MTLEIASGVFGGVSELVFGFAFPLFLSVNSFSLVLYVFFLCFLFDENLGQPKLKSNSLGSEIEESECFGRLSWNPFFLLFDSLSIFSSSIDGIVPVDEEELDISSPVESL